MEPARCSLAATACCPVELAQTLDQPRWFALLCALLAAGAVYVMWIDLISQRNIVSPLPAVFAIAGVAGLGAAGLMVNVNAALWNDPTAVVAELANQVPADARLVSFTPIDHRFAYYYRAPITELDWPRTPGDLPPNVDYFCFMRQWGDTAEARTAGRGRTSYKTPGTLPFAWEEADSPSAPTAKPIPQPRQPSCWAESSGRCEHK